MNHSRREFLADVGKGMLVAGVGVTLAEELGLARGLAAEPAKRLTFGEIEPLVSMLQETPLNKVLAQAMAKIKEGVDLKTLTAAAALANARAFGGEDYTGYHTFMALAPAYNMSRELPADRQALPVLKVIYRNTSRIQERSLAHKDTLHPVEGDEVPTGKSSEDVLREAARKMDSQAGDRLLASIADKSPLDAFNAVQHMIQDDTDVHRVVLSWRAWEALDFVGKRRATDMLRQSVHFCVNAETSMKKRNSTSPVRAALPRLLDAYKLEGKPLGKRKMDDGWVNEMCMTILTSDREKAADAVAAALAEGIAPEDIAEAMSLAANQLVLRDPGRTKEEQGKPVGSIHGASVGVHASDSANAWRNIARVSNPRNTVASLIVGAFHTAGQTRWANAKPYPWTEHLATVTAKEPKQLLDQLQSAIKSREQGRVCAIVQRYGELNVDPGAIFDVLLRFGVSEDGALHAEKYYATVREEFASTRPAFRWRHLVGLARVTASEYGFPAPGYEEACGLLKVSG